MSPLFFFFLPLTDRQENYFLQPKELPGKGFFYLLPAAATFRCWGGQRYQLLFRFASMRPTFF